MEVSFPLILAVWVLTSGLDDLIVYTIFLWRRSRLDAAPGPDPRAPEKSIAIWVPLWREDGVIERMLDHNRSAIRYSNYRFFVGVYPNDEPTQRAVRAAASRHPNVHVCVNSREGPTSKADCLNSIWRVMREEEARRGARYDIVLTHDAEDLIHPDSLSWVSRLADAYGMIQTPVLALPTPAGEFTHGVYCDDFALFHTMELPVRGWLGGFVPSSGVGTAFRRDALDLLASAHGGEAFAAESLTEDYENGYRLRKLGVKQLFAPLRFVDGKPLATREYFPRSFGAALRQRTRWITGIAFQAWRAHGWGGDQWYWLWRDRKGLIGNPLSLAANGWCVAWVCGWASLQAVPPWLLWATGGVAALQALARVWCSARVYGWRFGLTAPLRIPAANLLNALAALRAAWRFGRATVLGEALAWSKTDHSYPVGSFALHGRRLGEILVARGVVGAERLDSVLASRQEGERLGECLVRMGAATEMQVYEALAAQAGIGLGGVDVRGVKKSAGRMVPAALARRWRAIPLGPGEGKMEVATAEIPGEQLARTLEGYFEIPVRFRLVTQADFEILLTDLH